MTLYKLKLISKNFLSIIRSIGVNFLNLNSYQKLRITLVYVHQCKVAIENWLPPIEEPVDRFLLQSNPFTGFPLIKMARGDKKIGLITYT